MYADVEELVKTWLSASSVASLVTRTGGGLNIFKAMPNKAPLPAIVLYRSGGAPPARKELPLDVARISLHCWANSREAAATLALTLVGLIEHLAPSGGYGQGGAHLAAAETVMWLWLPDENSDTPRYIVDALFTVLSG